MASKPFIAELAERGPADNNLRTQISREQHSEYYALILARNETSRSLDLVQCVWDAGVEEVITYDEWIVTGGKVKTAVKVKGMYRQS